MPVFVKFPERGEASVNVDLSNVATPLSTPHKALQEHLKIRRGRHGVVYSAKA
jgi:hypothetical protein